jgi:PAS domain S-box-containing protein
MMRGPGRRRNDPGQIGAGSEANEIGFQITSSSADAWGMDRPLGTDDFTQLSRLVDAAVATTDGDGRITTWSPGAVRLLGWSTDEAVGRALRDLVPCFDTDADTDGVRTFRSDLVRRDGGRVRCEVRSTPRSGAAGDLVVVTEIDAEDALRAAVLEGETRYRSVFESMSEGVVVQSQGGAIVSCNPAAERILGLTRDQLEGRTSIDPRWRAVHADGSPYPGETHPAMVTLATGRSQYGVTMGVHTPDGRLRWIAVNSVPVGAGRGPPAAVVATFLDVTEARMQAEVVRDTVRRLNLLLDATSDGYWDRDLVADRTYLSPLAVRILEMDESNVESNTAFTTKLHPDDLPALREAVAGCLAGQRERIDVEARFRRRDAGWRWVHVRGKVAERDAQGRPVRLAGAVSDIDERQRLRGDLEAALATNVGLVARLETALGKALSGYLPVCAWCKAVRETDGEWIPLDRYVERHSEALVTHGMCPRCYEREIGEPPD